MKNIKAYTFEELLCEIPELEKYKTMKVSDTFVLVKKLLISFARSNKLKYIDLPKPFDIEIRYYFLFEKL